jgi:hypothetical protein
MDADRFDDVIKSLATGASRRRFLKGLAGSIAAAVLSVVRMDDAGARHLGCTHHFKACTSSSQCCSGKCSRRGICKCPGTAPVECGTDICCPYGYENCCARNGVCCRNDLGCCPIGYGPCCAAGTYCRPAAHGGGCCPGAYPISCSPYDGGGCCPSGTYCCVVGGYPSCCSTFSAAGDGAEQPVAQAQPVIDETGAAKA